MMENAYLVSYSVKGIKKYRYVGYVIFLQKP